MSSPPVTGPGAPYQNLLDRSRAIALIEGASALLNWDEETYMPRQGLAFRAEQLAFCAGWTHRQFTAPEVGDWIKACEDHGFNPESDEAANLREWRRAYDRATRLPPELVEQFNRTRTLARDAWTDARRRSDFARSQPLDGRALGLRPTSLRRAPRRPRTRRPHRRFAETLRAAPPGRRLPAAAGHGDEPVRPEGFS